MAESLNSQRAVFPQGRQAMFLLESKEELGCTWKLLAEIAGTSGRVLTGWKREQYSMALVSLKKICQKRKRKIPREVTIKKAFWYTTKGAQAGGRALIKKYGAVPIDEEYRQKKWREWWEREGKSKLTSLTQPLSFKKPEFSEELAEFVGIMLGDGGVNKHQVTVTLNSITDKEYLEFVQKLIQNLFGIPIGLYSHKQSLACRIVLSRTALVNYLVETVGLKHGNKIRQQVDIPDWIKGNLKYATVCVRGLIDTDGCVIIHQYFSKGEKYRYKKVSFTSRSYPLLQSVGQILSELKIGYRVTKDNSSLMIESQDNVKKYFDRVGTSNKKHEKRYKTA